MKIYFTGQPLRTSDYLELMRGRGVMYSYLARGRGVWADLSVFGGVALDSGAFSVWSRGAKVDIAAYADYCAAHERELDWYANLDSIVDWRATLRNQSALEARGLRPVPVYHLGEPWGLIEDLATSYDRVALGRGPGMKFAAIWRALEEVFARFTDAKGAPTVEFHGFRMTDRRLLARFPFESVDSTTWLAGVAYDELPTDTGRAEGFSFMRDTTKARAWLDFFDAAPKAERFDRTVRMECPRLYRRRRGAR